MHVTPLDIPLPASGQLTKVNEYVFWLRMPLPFALDHINLYLIKDDGGYAVLDTGIGMSSTQTLWESIFASLDKPITKVIVTHMHPDHIGMAGYIVDKYQVPLYMSFAEYFMARSLSAGPNGASNWQDLNYLTLCGMDDEYVTQAKEKKGGVGKVVKPIPLQFERLSHGQTLRMAGIDWQIIVGRGHSPEHLCLYSEAINTLLSGDHILPDITPNIGVYSTEPNANSLALYLSTLPQFLNLPKNTQVLPAHKLPFTGLHQRVNELLQHHQTFLDNLLAFCATEPQTVKACLPVLFKRPLNEHNMFFAIAEALSHLNYLYFDGQLERTVNQQGQWIFSR
ncbi:MBL fold metallo-hydrolase [Glaciecola sp. 1036]|uniref:MBL fold metallo-hydrolase n=1 Tax=Alteromonadaceae TaxID=72275 RepID=UPI003D0262CE